MLKHFHYCTRSSELEKVSKLEARRGSNARKSRTGRFSCFSLASTELRYGNQGGGGCYLQLLRRQHVVLTSQQRQDATQYALHILYLTKGIRLTHIVSRVVAAAEKDSARIGS